MRILDDKTKYIVTSLGCIEFNTPPPPPAVLLPPPIVISTKTKRGEIEYTGRSTETQPASSERSWNRSLSSEQLRTVNLSKALEEKNFLEELEIFREGLDFGQH